MPGKQAGFFVETMTQLGAAYRHLQQESQRKAAESATRRTLEQKMRAVTEQFERLSSQWIEDEKLRQAWAEFFYQGSAAPAEPETATPPLFKGVNDAGSLVEIRPSEDGGYDVIVDGSIESHEMVPWHLDPDMIEPIQIGEHTCREVFDVASEAMGALEAFQSSRREEPPWRWVRVLYEEGLVDEQFALTPRGDRALRRLTPQSPRPEPEITYGILVADAARARLFILGAASDPHAATVEPLIEVSHTTRPEVRAKDSDIFSDPRPGLRREGAHGPRHGVSDRREGQRHEDDRRFAAQLVEEATRLWRARNVTRAIVAASPAMLGLLRPALARLDKGPTPWSLSELDRDLSQLSAPALHDALAAEGVLPPRGRLPPLRPIPGQPV